MYGPENLIDREVLISRWDSGKPSNAQSGAHWFEAIEFLLSRLSRSQRFLCKILSKPRNLVWN